jgi:acyl carrier protein
MLDKDYGIQLKDPKEGKEIFKSITVLADYIARQKNI